MNKSGIYKITNITNDNFYIGSSSDLLRRKKQHKYDLNLNKHHSKYLQRAWNKYGGDNFKFEVLEYCPIENMLNIEQRYLSTLEPVYNVSKNATAFMLGVKRPKSFGENISRMKKGNKYFEGKTHTEETRKKMSKAKLGNKHNLGHKHSEEVKELIRQKTLKQFENGMPLETKRKLGKQVVQLSLDFQFITEYHTAREAAKDNNMGYSQIGQVCKGERNTTGGFRWMFLEDYLNKENREEIIEKQLEKERNLPLIRAENAKKNHGKTIVNLENGDVYNSIVECATKLYIKIDEVRRRTQGNSRQCGKIKFMYYDDYIKSEALT
jgi:group I intron endonuclease